MTRLLLTALPALALIACADTETDGDTAIDTTPDVEELQDLPDDYEPPVLEEGTLPPPQDGAYDTQDSDDTVGEIPDGPQS